MRRLATFVLGAARNPPGVLGVVDLAGGSGGNPKGSPMRPCPPHRLEALDQDWGRTARVPSLWVYADNDPYWGPELPRRWHQACAAGGARADCVGLPPHGDDGHAVFTRHPQAWQSPVAAFLDALGFAPLPRKDN